MAKIVDITNIDLKPTFVTKPDMRFATTFLSTKYRDYAVKGEAITDKATGEIFIKRPSDSRVVSFYQNKKYLRDLALEMRILINSHPDFKFEDILKKKNVNAFYVSTDYDVMSIFDEKDVNIFDKDLVIPNDNLNIHKITFPISNVTNGFFMRLTSRDSDRVLFSWMSAQYNTLLSNYSGTDTECLAQKELLDTDVTWKNDDCTVEYRLDMYTKKTDTKPRKSYTIKTYARVNEESCILFPTGNNGVDFEIERACEKVTVTILNITFDKFHFMLKHGKALDSNFETELNKFAYPREASTDPREAFIRYINICSFVDDSKDITLLNNEFLIALLDVPYIKKYMDDLATLVNARATIYSPEMPDDTVWIDGVVWVEPLDYVKPGGDVADIDPLSDKFIIEDEFSPDSKDLEHLIISKDATAKDNVLETDV